VDLLRTLHFFNQTKPDDAVTSDVKSAGKSEAAAEPQLTERTPEAAAVTDGEGVAADVREVREDRGQGEAAEKSSVKREDDQVSIRAGLGL
jgi:hypothetical protein